MLYFVVKSKNFSQKTTGQLVSLAPIDREVPVEILVRTAFYNWKRASDKAVVVFCTQTSGSGKTFLCKNLISILRADVNKKGPIFQSLVNGEYSGMPVVGTTQCNLSFMRQRQKGKLKIEQIQEVASARTIYIDIQNDLLDPIQQISFKRALYVAMYQKALKDKSINYQTSFAVPDPEEFCKVLKEKDGYDGKWCLVLDEIGVIEDHYFSLFQEFPQKTQTVASPQKGHISQESRYRVLLTIIGAIAQYVSLLLLLIFLSFNILFSPHTV